jgi:hypothetical protein
LIIACIELIEVIKQGLAVLVHCDAARLDVVIDLALPRLVISGHL